MDDADFSKLAAEINAYLADMVVKQEADSGEVMSEGDVNKIKRSFFTTTALYSIFFSDDDATDKVRVYLLEPREDGSTVVGMIVEDTEEYHSNAGFMIVPLTYRRFQPFVVKASNGDVDYDAAWHALFYFLQLKFSGPSSTKAHHALKRLRIAEDEDPLGPSTRLVRLVVRVNRAHPSDKPLVSDEGAVGHFLDALPEGVAGIVRERQHREITNHAQYTLKEMTTVAQQIFDELKDFENKCLRRALDQDNLHKYANSFPSGATRSALMSLTKPTATEPAKPLKTTPVIKRLTAPRTSTTASGAFPQRPNRSSATAPTTAPDVRLNQAGRELMRNLTGALSVDYDIDDQNATFSTTHHPDNLGGPHNLCIFCHRSLEQFHRPDCACHMSGQTPTSLKWATEGLMPSELRPYMAQLMVNLQRVGKQQPPLMRDQFNQKYCEPTSQATPTPSRLARVPQPQRGSTQQSYSTVPPYGGWTEVAAIGAAALLAEVAVIGAAALLAGWPSELHVMDASIFLRRAR
ncbi:hypothetical protein CYMTET_36937 [Cymbomonas tetramitiformis]|uniref:Uncharacterized protein n=1 Tax=Cymbomonas tetramitiformis TaxID=36881 RepID=A0AAE0CHC6_9CHLO|nr:hypothetical protein CYMTET_36937 [Cymbomonas tetramitiformis]